MTAVSADLFNRHYRPGGIARSLADRDHRDAQFQKVLHEIETETFVSQPANRGPKPTLQKFLPSADSRFHKQYGHDAALLSQMQRRRNYGSSNPLPPQLRYLYRPSEHAALAVIAWICKKKGACFLKNESIAEAAGVSVTTVRNAIREAKRLKHLCVVGRPRPGANNLTNIITVISTEWLAWMKRSIGVKGITPYKIIREKTEKRVGATAPVEAFEEREARTANDRISQSNSRSATDSFDRMEATGATAIQANAVGGSPSTSNQAKQSAHSSWWWAKPSADGRPSSRNGRPRAGLRG